MVLILDSLCRALLHRDLYWFVSLNNPYIYQETGRRTNWRKMKIDYFQFPGRVVESERARSLSGRWIYGSTLLSSERWRMWRIYMDFSRSDWMDCIYHEWVNHFGAFKAMSYNIFYFGLFSVAPLNLYKTFDVSHCRVRPIMYTWKTSYCSKSACEKHRIAVGVLFWQIKGSDTKFA